MDIFRAPDGDPLDIMITHFPMQGITGIALVMAAWEIVPPLPDFLITGHSHLSVVTVSKIPRLTKLFRRQELAQALAWTMEHPMHHSGSKAAG